MILSDYKTLYWSHVTELFRHGGKLRKNIIILFLCPMPFYVLIGPMKKYILIRQFFKKKYLCKGVLLMFSKFMKKNKVQVFSPLNGQVLPLEQVPDPVFSQKMMGEGVAIMPTGGDVVAPVDGTVVLISNTKHAIGIRTKDDTEVLIHVGLETVTLKGEGFTVFVNEGDVVSVGQKLMAVDWDFIKDKVPSIITPVVITNSADKSVEYVDATDSVAGDTLVMSVSSK